MDVATYCPLCVSRCGARATVTGGRFTLNRDPSHPTGKALCVNGKAAPDITAHPDQLRYPMIRTNPKGALDPGWLRISWDDAFHTVAERLGGLARDHGPESVVFSSVSPSTSAIVDSVEWIHRLRQAFGSPNFVGPQELCGWGRFQASLYTYGAPVPGVYMPDLDRAECILFWGYNPAVSRLAHATATRAALRRGAKLVVVDPRRAGLAAKADPSLRVRPGTDVALALAMINVMVERGWYDQAFVRRWTNGPFLVRSDTGRFLRGGDLTGDEHAGHYAARDTFDGWPVVVDPAARGTDVQDHDRIALAGLFEVATVDGMVACRPAFDLLSERCSAFPAALAEQVTGVPAAEIEHFCETQHRQIASLRRHVPDPQAELHPDTVATRGIAEGDWIEIRTPKGGVRARASFNDTLALNVVSGQHGWFEPCEELDLPGFPPFGPGSTNLNLVLSQTPSDPISGSSPLRTQMCEIARRAASLTCQNREPRRPEPPG
jgi:anaerobic selenocysteine-containing dehydrogenase